MSTPSNSRPDVAQVFGKLKNFQRNSANYIFQRMYLDADPTRRFLLADEVGLGKTHVARGVIARAIEHLSTQRVERIDIVYICSNADIARQNITKLNITGLEDCALPSRITLLPNILQGLKSQAINFVSFTPGTSFDLKSNTGRVDERILLYWLLRGPWRLKGRAPQNVFQAGTTTERFRKQLAGFQSSGHTRRIDRELRAAFIDNLISHDQKLHSQAEPTLRRRFKTLARRFHRVRENSRIPLEERRERNAIIGELRRVLAGTCIKALEPDLIILDEFQRFKHLLDGSDPASELARDLFDYEDARLLLISATPYKMYTKGIESESDDHYVDFIRTVKFLVNDQERAANFEKLINAYRRELYALADGHQTQLHALKEQLSTELRKIMVRTERLAVSADRDGMLKQETSPNVQLAATDLHGYLALQGVADQLEIGDMLEYWKSAPYLLNFMDEYQFKHRFEETKNNRFRLAELAQCLGDNQAMLLPWKNIRRYREVDPANARLRDLLAATVGSGAWQMLWIAPSLPYYQLSGVYRDQQLQKFTKRLIFSGWRVVPKVLATLVSYEAERRMLTSFDKSAKNTTVARKQRRGLLQFGKSDQRLTGMPLLALFYPCVALVRRFDPLQVGAHLSQESKLPYLEELLAHIEPAIQQLLKNLNLDTPTTGPVDEAWYWAAPVLLDSLEDEEGTRAWWDQEDLAWHWSDGSTGEDHDATRFEEHLQRVVALLRGEIELGRPPDDLAFVLAQLAVAGPGVCSLRALARGSGGIKALGQKELRNAAARITWSLRTLFNLPETMALLRGRNDAEPYWRRVLEYCGEGCLQAVLDEYFHMLEETLGLLDKTLKEKSEKLPAAINRVIGMHVSSLGVDSISVPKSSDNIRVKRQSMRARFAMRFGDETSEEDAKIQRASVVREAFNSPFWPFVLVTTSVGQEGLDFHPYCHAVVHWNLPSNPVDFEQREGRVHRYKGHAVRKNVAQLHREVADKQEQEDPWQALFEAATDPAQSASDLVPYWIYPVENGAQIQRFVPGLPLSQELDRLAAMRNSVAVYRMVFGQPRQDDLLEYLLKKLPKDQLTAELEGLRIDLTPPQVEQNLPQGE